jgi:hypothetical protein
MDIRGYSYRLVTANKKADAQHPGVKLGKLCIEKDIPVRDVANHFGVSRATIYKWFVGEWIPRKIHNDKITKIVQAKVGM